MIGPSARQRDFNLFFLNLKPTPCLGANLNHSQGMSLYRKLNIRHWPLWTPTHFLILTARTEHNNNANTSHSLFSSPQILSQIILITLILIMPREPKLHQEAMYLLCVMSNSLSHLSRSHLKLLPLKLFSPKYVLQPWLCLLLITVVDLD